MAYLDLFSKPFDCNTFDNLPPSQSVPPTFSTKLPKKLQFHSLSLQESDSMLSSNFKQLFTKIEKLLKTLRATEQKPDNILLIFDNINIIMNGCYSSNALDFMEVLNELVNFTERETDISLALGVNRDLLSISGDDND